VFVEPAGSVVLGAGHATEKPERLATDREQQGRPESGVHLDIQFPNVLRQNRRRRADLLAVIDKLCLDLLVRMMIDHDIDRGPLRNPIVLPGTA